MLAENGIIIPGGTTPTIHNISIAEVDDWSAIQLPANTHCKQILIKTRDVGTRFRLATTGEGSPDYITAELITIEIGCAPETPIFYIKSDAGAITVEVLSID